MKKPKVFLPFSKAKNVKLIIKQGLIAIIAISGLAIGSFTFAKTINLSGLLDMNGNGITGVSAEQALVFQGGHAMITNHDGYGNLNILSGIDHDNNLTGSDGGTRLELNESGWLDVEIYSGTNGTAGSLAGSYLFNSSELNMGARAISNAGTIDATTFTDPAGCDLAEYYKLQDPDSEIEAGDIVIMSQDANTIERSQTPYDRLVMGVVSTEPAVLIGNTEEVKNNKENFRPIALAGRVPVKVTTENGPIRKGDSIVTSSRPGYGMKCDDTTKCAGAVLGKAMEGLSEDEGVINILVVQGY
jgi:hypothetical protein